MRILLFAGLSVCLAGLGANAAVVSFDDLGAACDNTTGNVPDGYGGINWSGNWTCYSYSQPPYNPSSSPARVYDLSESTNFFSFVSAPQTFQGAYFSGNGSTVQFQLYSGINLVGSSSILTTTETPTFLSSGYGGAVDRVVVSSNASDNFIMDDVTFGGASSVPEPSTWMLLATGLGLFAGSRRFRTTD